MNATHLKRVDLSGIGQAMVDGVLQIKPVSFYKQFDLNTILLFQHTHGFYCLPTTELIDWLRQNIIGEAIEIGAGNGIIGLNLKIPTTDSHLQTRPDIKLQYLLQGQPVIEYPKFVEKLEADEAVSKYKPDTVLGSFITTKWKPGMDYGNMYGVDGTAILSQIKRYIHIGNGVTHMKDPMLKLPHDTYSFPWLVTRGMDQKQNKIWVWTRV